MVKLDGKCKISSQRKGQLPKTHKRKILLPVNARHAGVSFGCVRIGGACLSKGKKMTW